MNSPRLGFYVISAGIILQVFGLAGGSLTGDNSSGDVTLGGPSFVLLLLGMGLIIVGTVIGSLNISASLTPTNGDAPRLLPLMPLVLLATVSIATGAFAYQASDTASGGASAQAPQVTAPTANPQDCAEGYQWHPVMGHCMTPEQVAEYEASLKNGTEPAATPVCPAGYSWSQDDAACVSATGETPTGSSNGVPVCPAGYYWHPQMVHCMAVSVLGPGDPTEPLPCPEGYFWHPVMNHCMLITTGPVPTPGPGPTPVCPNGTYWHPVMNHCMPDENSCPPGWDYNPASGYCAPPPTDPPPTGTPPPNTTPTPPPSTTPPPSVTPTPTPECPAGFFWHPAMGHCMSTTCPPPLVFNPDTQFCELPTTPEPPSATPTPECPAGFFWHPQMGHCMSETCPPPLVFNPKTQFCELPKG